MAGMTYQIDTLIERIQATNNPTALGLDTQLEHIPALKQPGTLAEAAGAILSYNEKILDALSDIVPCVKVQVAYYEMYGLEGMRAFDLTLRMAAKRGLSVIADVKRNDIGATAAAYSAGYIGASPLGRDMRGFPADFITVNPYLGIDGIRPFLNDIAAFGGGIFVLVKTSNPSSGQLQDIGEPTIFERVADLTSEWGQPSIGKRGYSSVGAVVGATYPEQGVALRARMPHTFFLVPGYGAQGAQGADIAGCFDNEGGGAIVNASRSLLTAWQKHPELSWENALRAEAIRMRDDINLHINKEK